MSIYRNDSQVFSGPLLSHCLSDMNSHENIAISFKFFLDLHLLSLSNDFSNVKNKQTNKNTENQTIPSLDLSSSYLPLSPSCHKLLKRTIHTLNFLTFQTFFNSFLDVTRLNRYFSIFIFLDLLVAFAMDWSLLKNFKCL